MFSEKIKQWRLLHAYDFYQYFVAIMINNVLNLAMSIFAIFMLEKMSRAVWSIEYRGIEQANGKTQMDCEVAAGFYDKSMVDTDFNFSSFLHNIPKWSIES